MVPLAGEAQAARIVEDLLRRGIAIRPLKAFGLPNCIRISTGTDEENRMFVDAMKEICAKEEICNS
jgi:histidinol-phosphate aminotransferase